jgi:hypothetical protein
VNLTKGTSFDSRITTAGSEGESEGVDDTIDDLG